MNDQLDIDVAIPCAEWSLDLPDAEELAEVAVRATFAAVGGEGPAEVAVVLADDAMVQDLNREWRDQDKPTNVLSFAAQDGDGPEMPLGVPVMLGDVILAHGVCLREAQDEEKLLSWHFSHLVVHGMLHLMGYDHQADAEAEQMERLEAEILAGLGIPDPYAGLEDTDR